MKQSMLHAATLAALICITWSGSSAEIPVTDGLVAQWEFDETSGLTASDSSGNNNGALINFADDGSQWVAGRNGGAIAFDGSNHIEVPDDSTIGGDITSSMTIMTWFKSNVELAANGAGNRMLEKSNSYFLLQGVANGGMNFLVKDGGSNRTAGIGETLNAGVWYHITGVVDETEIRVYINGVLKNTVNIGGPVDDAQLPLFIGSDDSGNHFNGLMDQLLIYNRPVSEAEINNIIASSEPQGVPVVATDPQSTTIFEGSTLSLQVGADGEQPLSFLWYKGDEILRSQTTDKLLITDVSTKDAGDYRVAISNNAGEIKSASATVTVTPVTGLETGRVAYWSFDESGGSTAADGSSNRNDGELLGFAGNGFTSAQVNNGLNFDGLGALVAVGHDDNLNQIKKEASIAFWVKPRSYGEIEEAGSYTRASSYILRKGNHLGIRLVNDPGTVTRTLTVRAGDGDDNGGVQKKGWEVNAPQGLILLNEWQHFTIVYKNDTVTMYKNGIPLAEPAEGHLGAPNDLPLTMGSYDDVDTALRFLDGALDELSIWQRPISEAEILEVAGKDIAGAPVIEIQPAAQKKLEGTSVTFSVVATGMRPVSYQWLHKGQSIEGATNRQLTLQRLLPSNAGAYSVEITNTQGAATSENAVLTIEELGAITSGLAAHFTFDETSGETVGDVTDNKMSGTLFNFDDGAFQTGMIGGSLFFDGEDDFVEVTHSDLLNLTTDATVSVWLNPVLFSGGSDFDRVIRKDVNYDFVLIKGGVARVHGIGKTPYSSPGNTVDAEIWQHFAYVAKSGTIQWYKNGEPVGNPLNGRLGELNTLPLVLGNYEIEDDSWINRPYQGGMDDLGIWQRALSANDILSIYANGLSGKPLSEELDPITIESFAADGDNFTLSFFTPFSARSHSVQIKETMDSPWSDLEGLSMEDQGDGRFSVTFANPENMGFYQIVSLPPPPVFEDDFESGAEGWTHGGSQDEWELGTPTAGPNGAASGSNAFATDLDGNFEPNTDAWLLSPVIDLTEVTIANLSFSEFHAVDVEIDFHNVSVNILDGDSGDLIQQVFLQAGSTADWTQRNIRLAGPNAGRKIRIEFRLVTDTVEQNFGFYIDDVIVTPN
ncbi:immunoglobulin domain-containing protein [Verrucomicrobia bacterium]|nr:immunoglobulin domain-containing protein [Verrucomicrobiota bacterium]MDB4778519.1 immunoglobulin domain-containing protein [Verrucomicrobiota bacterium]